MQPLSEEILLEILSYLTIHELLLASRTCRQFHRLCDEPLLWRRIYHSLFTLERLKPPFSPAQQQPTPYSEPKGKGKGNQLDPGLSWKTLCRVSLNWKTGSAGLTRISPLPTTPTTPTTPGPNRSPSSQDPSPHNNNNNTIVRFYRSLVFITFKNLKSSVESPLPVVYVYNLEKRHTATHEDSHHSVLVGKLVSSITKHDVDSFVGLGITEISIDESSHSHSKNPAVLLSVFYTNGAFSIFKVYLPSTTSTSSTLDFLQVASFLPSTSWSKQNMNNHHHELVETAKFYYPLIVTCSVDFHIKFYQLLKTQDQDEEEVKKISVDMQNSSCYWPLSLSLRGSKEKFKLKIAYPMPFYPSAWTIGLQEFEFQVINQPSSSCTPSSSSSPSLKMQTNRFITPLQYSEPNKGTTSTPPPPTLNLNQVGLGSLIIGIEQSAENLIVGRSDNTIDFFSLNANNTNSSSSSTSDKIIDNKTTKLVCSKRLFGHTSRIGSLSIDDTGRCVSAALDGIKVWDKGSEPVDIKFTSSTSTSCQHRDTHNDVDDGHFLNSKVSWIGLDYEKIVSLCCLPPKPTPASSSLRDPPPPHSPLNHLHHNFIKNLVEQPHLNNPPSSFVTPTLDQQEIHVFSFI